MSGRDYKTGEHRIETDVMKLDRYFTWDVYRGGEKDESFSTRVEAGHTEDEVFILVQSQHRKNTLMDGFKAQYNKVVNFGSESVDMLNTIIASIEQDLTTPSGTTVTKHLNVEGTFKNHHEDGSDSDFDDIKLEINENGLHFHPFKNEDYVDNVLVPSRTEMRDGERSDENELKHLLSLLENVRTSYLEPQVKQQGETDKETSSLKDEDIVSKSVETLIQEGEDERIEFKETFLYDVHQDQPNKELKSEVVKEIAGLTNADGGVILIGVEDDSKEVKGLERDLKIMSKGKDEFGIQLQNEISGKLGDVMDAVYTGFEFKEVEEGKEVCIIWVEQSPEPVYFDEGNDETFIVRSGTSAKPLGIRESIQYINEHWENK